MVNMVVSTGGGCDGVKNRTQAYVHEAARGGLEKGILCNLGTLKVGQVPAG